MLITNHVLAGAIIGSLSRNETTAFAAGIASHFALDSIPHWGARSRQHFLTTAVIDGLVGATVLATIAVKVPKERRNRVVAGMLGACLPDADKPVREVFGDSPFPAAFDRFHARIQIESPERLGQEFVVATLLGSVVGGLVRSVISLPRSTRRSRRRPAHS